GVPRVEKAQKITNEDIIEQEQKPMGINDTPKTTLSRDDLIAIAKEKGIKHHHMLGHDKLYALLFGEGAAA
ncbi:MAG: hypothetical protein DSY95_05160, partial [SAR324 cluster bacterium]